MNNIIIPDESFDFDHLQLSTPILTTGGSHVIHCSLNNEPFYIQPPKSRTKQGINLVGKKMYSDLMYSQENQRFIQWMENLETYFQEHLFKNKDKWFDSSLELHDIENFFSSPLKSYKSGKYYLCRANIKNNLGKSSIKIFDEDENELTVESLTTDNEINTILEIKGIRCTSSSFNVEIEIKQMMVLKPNNLFEKCLFTRNKKSLTEMADNTTQQPVEEGEVKVDNTEQQIPVVEDQLSVSEEPIIIEENVEEVKNLEEVESVVVADIEEDVEDVYQPELVEEEVRTSPDEVKETNKDSLEEIDFTLDEINEGESIQIKQRNDIHYEMYREAKRKAKMARDLALSSYLEAKRIKNTYMLENIEDSESSDLEMEELEQQEDE
jgi:hypothetical protein|uniref:Uncharacterized protein n=1 Tax=viral metagenome TaxID=1070528 RepID=A0A6C0IP12_9ZZZZ